MDYKSLSDRELLIKCIDGDGAARDFFVESYSRLVYNSIHETFRMYSSDFHREDVEDLHNSIFVSLFKDDCRKLRQYRGDNNCSVASWLRIVSINTSINFVTRTRTHRSLDNAPEEGTSLLERMSDSNPSALHRLMDAEELALFRELLGELKPDDRLLLKYFYKGELSAEEIGKIMNIAVNSVYSRISRIKKKMQELLKNRNNPP